MNVGELLERHPRFSFDVEEYVLSMNAAEALRQRRAAACHAVFRNAAVSYRDKVLAAAGTDRWDGLPLISKADLRAQPQRFIRASDDERWGKTTTGSTGPPIEIQYSGAFYFDLLLSVVKTAMVAGVRDLHGAYGVFAMTISDLAHLGEHAFADPTGDAGLLLHVIVDASRPETLCDALSLAEQLGVSCISSKPSLLEMLCDIGGSNAFRAELVISGGAELSSGLRRRIEKQLGRRTIDVYGMTEVGLIAFSCPDGSWHIDSSACEVEIVGGEIVVTAIDNEAMPLVRYRTGDQGELGDGLCACGSPSPRLVRLAGRIMRCFRCAGDARFAPTYFNDLFTRFPLLREFQLSQLAVGEYELRADVPETSLAAIEAHVRASIPGQPEVRAVVAAFPPDSKFQRYRTCFDD